MEHAVRRAQYNGRRDACRYEITHRDECHADKSQYQYRVSSRVSMSHPTNGRDTMERC